MRGVLATLMVALAALMLTACEPAKPEATVAAFLDAAQRGDVNGMLALTHGDLKQQLSEPAHGDALLKLVHADALSQPIGDETEPITARTPNSFAFGYDIQSEFTVIKGDTATVRAILQRKQHSTPREYTLRRVDGQWRLVRWQNIRAVPSRTAPPPDAGNQPSGSPGNRTTEEEEGP